MAIFPIRTFPDPVLSMDASEVTVFDDRSDPERFLARFREWSAKDATPVFAALLHALAHLAMPETQAERLVEELLDHRREMARALGRDPGPARSRPARSPGANGQLTGMEPPAHRRETASSPASTAGPRAATTQAGSGRSAAWLARLTGGQEVGSSNLPGPTITSPPGDSSLGAALDANAPIGPPPPSARADVVASGSAPRSCDRGDARRTAISLVTIHLSARRCLSAWKRFA